MTVKSPVLLTLLASALITTGCSASPNDADLGLERALEACTQDAAAGGSVATIAALAAEAAALDPRWRPLADYAGSLKASQELAERLEEQERDPNDAELEILTQGLADGDKLLTECDAVVALAE